MKEHILIVEDEPLIAEEMKLYLDESGYSTAISHSINEALQSIGQQHPALILLDINLGECLSGIDLAKLINERYQIPFIFITSYGDQTTIESSKFTMPAGYLLKPFDEKELLANVQIALYKQRQLKTEAVTPAANTLFIKDKGKLIRIRIPEICWAQAYDNYTYLHMKDSKLLISHTLKWMEDYLPSPQFVRVHRSYIVNFDKVDSINENKLIIQNHEIPIGRTFREVIQTYITAI